MFVLPQGPIGVALSLKVCKHIGRWSYPHNILPDLWAIYYNVYVFMDYTSRVFRVHKILLFLLTISSKKLRWNRKVIENQIAMFSM